MTHSPTPTQPSAELLPCPFCGTKARLMTGRYKGEWYVDCHGCSVMHTVHLSEASAVKAWNTRAKPPSVAGTPGEDAKARIEDGCIVIKLSLDSLVTAVSACPAFNHYFDDEAGEFTPPIVTDASLFATDLVRELNREEEDGTTRIHLMFDAAFVEAIEQQGAEGVAIHGDPEYTAAQSRAQGGVDSGGVG